jgi:hypothetical protein
MQLQYQHISFKFTGSEWEGGGTVHCLCNYYAWEWVWMPVEGDGEPQDCARSKKNWRVKMSWRSAPFLCRMLTPPPPAPPKGWAKIIFNVLGENAELTTLWNWTWNGREIPGTFVSWPSHFPGPHNPNGKILHRIMHCHGVWFLYEHGIYSVCMMCREVRFLDSG